MTLSKHAITITETETEFLLSIHASHKSRAKTIPNYRWDTERRYWVYPKTAKVYDALIDEFGDDLTGILTINRPGKPLQPKTTDFQTENQALKEEIAKIHKTLELISETSVNVRVSEADTLRSALAAKESEIAENLHRIQNLEKQLKERRSTNQLLF